MAFSRKAFRMKTKLLAGCAVAAVALLGANSVGATGNPAPPVPRYVAPPRADVVRVADLFGESDEEKAARKAHEDAQDAQIRALNDKVRDLQDSTTRLTGQNEELSHRITELNDKIERQQKDFEYRLCAMAAQQLGSGTGQGDATALPCPGMGGSAAPAPQVAPSPTAPLVLGPPQNATPHSDTGAHLAPPPGVLGTLPAGQAATAPAPAAAPPAANDDAVHAQYTAAMGLLAKARYDDARAAFRSFADANPTSDLTPNAVFWIGDIAYVQKDYDTAEHSFAEVVRKYPTAPKAADSMLKLGQALLADGKKKEGCTALAAVTATRFPKATKTVLAQSADARKAAACKPES
jgi:tol-pal system protein YbgF